MEKSSVVVILFVLFSTVQCEAERTLSILVIANPLPGHLMTPSSLGEELVQRGHNVTLCTTPMSGSTLPEKIAINAGMNFINAGEGYLSYREFQQVFAASGIGNSTESDRWKVFNLHPDTSIKMGNFLDKNNITDYDFIIASERMSPVLACLSKKWNVPGLIMGTTHQNQNHHLPAWPFPPYYANKRGRLQISDDMTFLDRMYTFLFVEYNKLFNRFYKSRFEYVCTDATADYSYMNTFLGIRAPHIISTVIGFEYPRTASPLTYYVGPVISKQKKEIPAEMLQWLDAKPRGSVILISMGSLAHLTRDQGKIIVDAISMTNYTVVWSLRELNRYIVDGLEMDSDKFLLSTWLPQLSVLNHSAVGIALMHGGMNGVHEALACGVPIIMIPFWNDQADVGARLQHSGAGIQILRQHLTVESLQSAILHIQKGELCG